MKQYGIQTDVKKDFEFFQPYFDKIDWVESWKHYGEKITDSTGGPKMEKLFIKNIPFEMWDFKLTRFVHSQFKKYGIKTDSYRCDFFLVKEGGYMPPHKDVVSDIAFLLPLSENTGTLGIEDEDGKVEVLYNSMFILNTKKMHWVNSPTKDRLLFRIAVHDFPYTEIVHPL